MSEMLVSLAHGLASAGALVKQAAAEQVRQQAAITEAHAHQDQLDAQLGAPPEDGVAVGTAYPDDTSAEVHAPVLARPGQPVWAERAADAAGQLASSLAQAGVDYALRGL